MKIEQLNQSMLLYFGAHTGIYWICLGNKNEKENQLHKHIKQERAKLCKVISLLRNKDNIHEWYPNLKGECATVFFFCPFGYLVNKPLLAAGISKDNAQS